MTDDTAPRFEEAVWTDTALAEYLGVSRRQLSNRRDLKPVTIGTRKVYLVRHVLAYLEAQAGR